MRELLLSFLTDEGAEAHKASDPSNSYSKWWIWDSNAGESDFTASALNLLLTPYAPGKAKHADLTPKPAGT